jgi:hypothetical protein
MRKSIEPNYLSLFAGLWFAVASCIPVIFIFVVLLDSYDFVSKILLFAVLPISITFLLGFGLGSDILIPHKVKTSKQAMIKGLKVALSSYLVFIPLFAISIALYHSIFDRTPHEWLAVDFVRSLFASLIIASYFGSIIIGWLVLIVGAIAGWLLLKYRLLVQKRVS